MPDRERVIRELEQAKGEINPVSASRKARLRDAVDNALALLKEQDGLARAVDQEHLVNEYLNKRLADRPEIVRCRDCKFRQSRVSRIINGKECNLCEMVKGYKPADWFCADGERWDRNA